MARDWSRHDYVCSRYLNGMSEADIEWLHCALEARPLAKIMWDMGWICCG